MEYFPIVFIHIYTYSVGLLGFVPQPNLQSDKTSRLKTDWLICIKMLNWYSL
ncbi:hypothetical protein CRC_03355 [Cylindrospermopsis raciborskii CS-505]|nr:hypothetical protein CRC_03355 [Cylindrospermopsis raciborskii CS-505]